MEDYFKHVFLQKDIEEYLSSNAEESINLDFKRGEALNSTEASRKEIAKDVSAFANSDGGIIVYGIAEKDHKANNLAFVNGNEITKEWLEQIINSRIQRKIEGLLIDPIRYDEKLEQTIYVIKIPMSLNAPHRTSDKKFYKRYNFESVEMEEYEIRGLYSRLEKTHLEIVKPQITGSPYSLIGDKISEFSVNINFNIENKGKTIEKLYKLEVHIPRQLVIGSNQFGYEAFYKHLVRHEDEYSIFSIPNSSPLFQNEYATIANVNLKIGERNFHNAEKTPFKLKLYYSHGINEFLFLILDYLEFKGSALTLELFKKQS